MIGVSVLLTGGDRHGFKVSKAGKVTVETGRAGELYLEFTGTPPEAFTATEFEDDAPVQAPSSVLYAPGTWTMVTTAEVTASDILEQ